MQQQSPAAFRDQTRNNYDRLSGIYELLTGGAEKRLINQIVGSLEIEHPQSIIEIGFGTGNGLIALRKKFPTADLTGVDLSYGMCRQASRKWPHDSHSVPFRICQGDALNLPFGNNAAGLVFISFTFELLPQNLQIDVLCELKRILAPQGRIAVIAMHKDKDPGWISRLYAAAHRRFPKIIDCRPLQVEEVFRRAGFSVSGQQIFHIWGLPVIALITH